MRAFLHMYQPKILKDKCKNASILSYYSFLKDKRLKETPMIRN